MGKIIAIANQKGGVGKTTTAINLAAGISFLQKKILLVDFDPQGNATQGLGCNIGLNDDTVYDSIIRTKDAASSLKTLPNPPLDILPANINLAGAELELAKIKENREQALKNILSPIRRQYDYIFIDCPPSLGLLNTNALSAADSVIIPVQCEYYALEGLTQLLQTIRLVQKLFNPKLRIEGVVLTMHDMRTNLSIEVQQEVKSHFKEKAYKTVIPRNVKLSEAPSRGLSIYNYAINSEGAKAYLSLIREFLANQKNDVNQEVNLSKQSINDILHKGE